MRAVSEWTSQTKSHSGMGWVDRVLSLADDEEPRHRRTKLASLLLVFLLGAILEYSQLYFGSGAPKLVRVVCMFGYSISALLVVAHRWERLASLIALIATTAALYRHFPGSPNHALLVFLIFLFLTVIDLESQEEQKLALQAVRWLAAITFFLAGVQKLIYGTYFHGDYRAPIRQLEPISELGPTHARRLRRGVWLD